MNIEVLYHYTSLENLALILNTRKIRFNSLENVDDKLEGETEDVGKIGKHLFVSCWTHTSAEDISLWSLYTNNMTGIRVRMKANPFKQISYKKGEFALYEDTNCFIDLDVLKRDNKSTYANINESYFEVKYTNDRDLLRPKCYNKESGIIDLSDCGDYKKLIWAFQQEVRYAFFLFPFTNDDYFSYKNNKSKDNPLDKFINNSTLKSYEHYDVELADDALDDIEVVTGPRMSEGDFILVDALMKQYCKNYTLKRSELPIR